MPIKKHLKIILIVLPLVFTVLIISLFWSSKKESPPTTSNKELPTPTPTSKPFNPSKWSNDEEVLSLETEINQAEKDFSAIDIKLLPLQPPVFEQNLEF